MENQIRQEVMKFGDKLLAVLNPAVDLNTRPTKDLPLSNLDDAAAVASVYLLFVFFAPTLVRLIVGNEPVEAVKGMTVMQKFGREPLLILMAIYNLIQVVLCGYMVVGTILLYLENDYKFICNDFSLKAPVMANMLWIFYVSKVLDFADTFFIILRRKWRQLSFLHVYHHTSIFLVYWANLAVGYDGDIYYTIALNAFIHFVMYLYYLLTTFNIPVPMVMKIMVTNMQLLQFATMMSQAAYILYFGCPFPALVTWFYLFYIFSLFLLFTHFKMQTYGKAKADAKKGKKTN